MYTWRILFFWLVVFPEKTLSLIGCIPGVYSIPRWLYTWSILYPSLVVYLEKTLSLVGYIHVEYSIPGCIPGENSIPSWLFSSNRSTPTFSASILLQTKFWNKIYIIKNAFESVFGIKRADIFLWFKKNLTGICKLRIYNLLTLVVALHLLVLIPKGGVRLFVNELTRLKISPDRGITMGLLFWLVKVLLYIPMCTLSTF